MDKNAPIVVSEGLVDLITDKLNANETGYEGTPKYWNTTVNISLTPQQTKTDHPANNNPAAYTSWSSLLYAGTIEFLGMSNDDFENIFATVKIGKGGIGFGSMRHRPFPVGMAFKDVKSGENGLLGMLQFFKVIFENPPVSRVTTSREGTDLNRITCTVTCYPVTYALQDGSFDTVTYAAFDNKRNADVWDEIKDSIVFPTEYIAPEEVEAGGSL